MRNSQEPGAEDLAPRPALPARRLERELGKPSSEWKSQDLLAFVQDRGIRVVSLMHVGGDGWLKALDFAPRSLEHLKDVIEGGERADGSSIFGSAGIEPGASDILLRPRVSSAFLDPFSALPTLALLCGHADRDGKPLPVSPDTIVRAAAAHAARETGTELMALGEVEFFLGRHGTEADAYGSDDHGYHAASPFVFGERLRREAMTLLAEIGVPIKYGHSEVGYIRPAPPEDIIWEQHEIEMSLAPLADAADHVVLTQWVLRNLAHGDGMRCSFDPIMRKGHAGSGLHFHFSPVRDGRHCGRCDEQGRLSTEAQWLVAGLCCFGAALMAFGNRVEGSFARLVQGKETPTAITWGRFDRHALVRIPLTARAADGREVAPPTIEFRLPDGSAHPHLLLAGVAQAYVSGRRTEDIDNFARGATGRGTGRLPVTAREIAEALQEHRAVLEEGSVFPPGLIDHAIASLG
ncbi:MAG: glutamine synthetase family protein [Planctomycetota bacterium]